MTASVKGAGFITSPVVHDLRSSSSKLASFPACGGVPSGVILVGRDGEEEGAIEGGRVGGV